MAFTNETKKKHQQQPNYTKPKKKKKQNKTKRNQFHIQALITDTRPKNMMDLPKRKVLIQSHQVCYVHK